MEEENNTTNEVKGKSPMKTVGIIISLLIVVGGIIYMSSKNTPADESGMQATDNAVDETSTLEPTPINSESDDANTEEEVVSGSIQVEVEGGSFYYEPNRIEAKVGDTIKIVFTSVDMMHDFVIDELDVKSEVISAGNTTAVEFTVNQAGEFEFYCSVGNHRAQGMVGTLVVTE